ncbi:MAG: ATP-binding protein [Bdellovibrionota bacterium]
MSFESNDPKRIASLLRATLESTIDGILVTDREGKIVTCNKPFYVMWNIPEEIIRVRDHKLAIEFAVKQLKDPESFLKKLRELYSKPLEQSFDILEFKDDRIFERYSRPQLIDDKPVGRVWSFRDVSLHYRLQQERLNLLLKEQHSRTLAELARRRATYLANASTVLDASLDLRETISAVTALVVPQIADCCILDLKKGDWNLERAKVAHQDPFIQRDLHALENSLTSNTGPCQWLKTIFNSDDLIEFDLTQEPLIRMLSLNDSRIEAFKKLKIKQAWSLKLEARNRVIGILTLGVTSPERRQGLQDRELVHGLAGRSALAIDNAILYRDANEAIHARHEFVSVASHELKTPLSALYSYVQLIERALQSQIVEKNKLQLLSQNAEKQCKRVIKFVQQLLDVSYLEHRNFRLELENVDLCEVVHDVVKRVRASSSSGQNAFILALPKSLMGRFDRIRIEQILTNLISNAVKYGENKPVEISIEQRLATVCIEVRDHGIGISSDQQKRIFQRFERAVSSRSYAGTGLGLWITSQIVEAHGGTIRVESKPKEGSTFIVELPLKVALANQESRETA